MTDNLMAGFNFGLIPKVFADTFHISINPSGAFFGLQSGDHVHGFVIPLSLAKVLQKSLKENLDKFEEKNGIIDTSGATRDEGGGTESWMVKTSQYFIP